MDLEELHPKLKTYRDDYISISDCVQIIKEINNYIQITDWKKKKYTAKELEDHVLKRFDIESKTIHALLFRIFPEFIKMVNENDNCIKIKNYRDVNYFYVDKKYNGIRYQNYLDSQKQEQ